MNPTEQMKRQQQYKTYVDQKTPRHNLWLNMLRAFLTGGAVCVLGQIIFNLCELQKLSQDDCSNWTSMLLVLISVILTGTGIYPKLAKWGGAGALVPITGFANSVAAPAIEYKKEGQVFHGCRRQSGQLCFLCFLRSKVLLSQLHCIRNTLGTWNKRRPCCHTL